MKKVFLSIVVLYGMSIGQVSALSLFLESSQKDIGHRYFNHFVEFYSEPVDSQKKSRSLRCSEYDEAFFSTHPPHLYVSQDSTVATTHFTSELQYPASCYFPFVLDE